MNHNAAAPMDIRLMNLAALVLGLVFVAMGGVTLARWISRLSVFDIHAITVLGDSRHNNSVTLRANVAPRIAGTFFTADLSRVRNAFEAAPWVRHAVVHRDFPNRLRVTLQEHVPVALWSGEGGEQRLVNSYGEVFEANVAEVDQDNLPTLSGPEGQSAETLQMYRALQSLFEPMDMPIEQLVLSGRGSWSAHLSGGATVELGRGSVDEVRQRAQRFVRTLTQVVTRYGRQANAIESADLRHDNGYAIRLNGVTTTVADAGKK